MTIAELLKADEGKNYLGQPHRIRAQVTEHVEAQVEAQVGAQVDFHILQACTKQALSSAEIAAALGHKSLSGNLRKALPALREAGLLVSYVAKGLLPYHGLGSGIKRALDKWPTIDFADDHDGCLFTATVQRRPVEELELVNIAPEGSSRTDTV